MSYPDFDDLSAFTPAQQDALRQFLAYLVEGFLAAQHKEDGTHSAITADSITVAKPSMPLAAGNVTGDLIPTADRTYSLGAFPSTTPVAPFTWKNGYFGDHLYLGVGSSGGLNPVAVPAWTVTLSGTRVTWQPAQTAQSVVFNNSSGSAAVTISPDSLVGSVLSSSSGITASGGYFEHGRTTRLGEWASVAYDATNFTASAGTWTVENGDQQMFAYTLVGKTLHLQILLSNTSVSTTPATLAIKIPGGFTTAKTMSAIWGVFDNSSTTAVPALAFFSASATAITVFRLDGANFSASTNNTGVYGSMTFEIQ